MYGYIYKTTNLINNKIYVGQHKATTFDKSYYGSGKLLKDAIKKYGIENFNCEVLEWCETVDELNACEQKHIAQEKSKSIYGNYNMSDGGHVPRMSGVLNPNYGVHRPHTEEEKRHLSEVNKGHKPTFTRKRTPEEIKQMSERSSMHRHSEEAKKKISDHHSGAAFLTNGVEQHWFYGDDIQKALSEGWTKGICKSRKKKAVTAKSLAANERNSKRHSATKWVHKGAEKIQVKRDELESYLANGYKLGMKDKAQ